MQITINNNICNSLDEIKQFASTETANFIEEYFNELP